MREITRCNAEPTDLLNTTRNIESAREIQTSRAHGKSNKPLGLSTMFEVEMLVPEIGVNASFWRVHEVRSVDWVKD